MLSPCLIIVGVHLNHLGEITLGRFLHWRVILFSLSILYSLEGSHCTAHTQWVGSDALPFWEQSIFRNDLQFFCRWHLYLHRMYLFNCLFIPVCIICIYILRYNPILFCFSNYYNFTYWDARCMPLIYPYHCGLFLVVLYFLFVSTFLLFGTTRCSSLIFYISRHSSQQFHWKTDLKNQDLGTHCYWGVVASRLTQRTEKGIYVYSHLCLYMYL